MTKATANSGCGCQRSSRPAPPRLWRPLSRARERSALARQRAGQRRATLRAISLQMQRLAAMAPRVLVAAPHRCGSQAAILAAASCMRCVAGTSTASPMKIRTYSQQWVRKYTSPQPQCRNSVLQASLSTAARATHNPPARENGPKAVARACATQSSDRRDDGRDP